MQNLRGVCAMGVMAKAPLAGRAKTRLCPPLHPAQAASLSAAFLRDISENITLAARDAPIQGFVAYAPAGEEQQFDGLLADGTGLVLADGSPPMPHDVRGFGRCLLHAAQALFALGVGAVCLVNADGPTLPTEYLIAAARALSKPGERIVLGPADDGGYYLLGMQQPHPHLFADIAWSTQSVAATTRARATTLGLEVVMLPAWYDVDDVDSMNRLIAGDDGGYVAPATNAWIDRNGMRARLNDAAQ
ncbi:MAG TPA: TIGR04282 family arsenosugar biosynthesis glycosyltransferase [Acetobacteraceae bacterium]|nr:TIGR04282 family arsenosugar biosynthesis glycosyltransferase [Acetobacteraceae bacterium]